MYSRAEYLNYLACIQQLLDLVIDQCTHRYSFRNWNDLTTGI